ncbi:transmembrane protein 201 isoform X2 [Sceloporus undulatus]|uniref:transmembrane protein 201 isoform X2 n=1 Tax=Sceloporus undulatus TaxID=8520 RepID=UPI001C4CA58A|nr:transmembrane protein 201 isoform X2 [Sceloporus undulatus]
MTVNCWFCNQDTLVPYGNRNCWDCPNCEQYNGFQENGDYNKPIPAQYMEHLNHVVSGAGAFYDPTKPQQWVSSQVLLCRKCNNHQTLKIKQLASFTPREEGKYDEEIEVYKHHLEQTYKLCRPCQAAVEYYIKHQNRQLRALLLRHHFSHRKTDKTYMQSFYAAASSSTTTPVQVIALRFLAFLSCAILVTMALYGSGNPFSPAPVTTPASPSPGLAKNGTGPNMTAIPSGNGTLLEFLSWQEVIRLLPDGVVEMLNAAWSYGKSHQIAVVVLGLLTCILAMLLAGRIRLRRIDAFASVLWLLVMGFHLAENYLQTDPPSWLDTAKFGTTSLCCLVGFAAAVATRKPMGQRKPRPRRYLSGDSVPISHNSGAEISFSYLPAASSVFVPTPPSLLPFTHQQHFRSPRRTSSCSLPGRLNRALSLGTIPSLARTDSGYLFSGSRPPSQMSFSKESSASDYFSLFSGSCVSSLVPSSAASVAGSVASSSGSLRYRRPLISPARLNLKGQRLMLFSAQSEGHHSEDLAPSENNVFASELPAFPKRNLSERGLHGHFGRWSLRGLLTVSLTINAIFTSAYLYQNFR